MAHVTNTSSAARTWPNLAAADGTTLHLEAGGEADVDLPADLDDPWLQTKKRPASAADKPSAAKDKE